MSQKVIIMFMKTTFPISGHLFDTIANNHYAPFCSISPNMPTYIEKSRPISTFHLTERFLKIANIGGKIKAANIYENLSSIFLNSSLPYTKLPVGL